MTTLRESAQQALDYMKSVGQMDMHPEEWAIVGRLEAALAEPWPAGVVTSMVKGGVTWHIWPDQMADGTTLYAAAPIIQPEIKDDKPVPPPEAQTEAEKVAYCAGWWAAMEKKREQK